MERAAPCAEYIAEADILFVQIQDALIAGTREAGGNRWINVDYSADGIVLGVEFVDAAAQGVDLSHIPERQPVERLIRETGNTLPIVQPA